MLIKRNTSRKVATSHTVRDCFSNPSVARRRPDRSQMRAALEILCHEPHMKICENLFAPFRMR